MGPRAATESRAVLATVATARLQAPTNNNVENAIKRFAASFTEEAGWSRHLQPS
jgi:hypothetical protein